MTNVSMAGESYISGTVIHIIFRNEENGYTVLLVKVQEASEDCQEKKVTAVGHFPVIETDERYRFEGQFKEHPRFGRQYHVQTFQKELPTEREAFIQYLASDRFPGIGEKTAEKMVDTFGENVITIILDNKEKLQKIKGLNEKTRQKIYEAMLENQGMERAMTMLTQYGFGMDLAVKIYHAYRETTFDVIQETPYKLVWDVEGIGFVKADRLGRSMGIGRDDPERLKAGLLYVLYEKTMQGGHVYVPHEYLLEEAGALLSGEDFQVGTDMLQPPLLHLIEEDQMVEEEQRVYLPSLYFAEKGFVTKIKHMTAVEEMDVSYSEADFLKALGETEEEFNIEYAEHQKEAIRQALSSQLMILTGGPGTGKTTVIRAIVQMFSKLHEFSLDRTQYKKDEPFPVLLAAPTGRAAKRMKESTGLEASTIHKLLGYSGEGEEDVFEKDEDEPLEGKLLVVDEVSMVDMWLANQLFRSIPEGMQVILVGDEDQLPSVGPGQVLTDLMDSGTVPVTALSVVYRQAEGSSIIQLAHSIKQGTLPPDLPAAYEDRRFFPCSRDNAADLIEQVCAGAFKKGYPPMDIQVLAPMYKGPAGVHELNRRLQQLFNPPESKSRKVTFGDAVYSKGDVILQLVNNPEEQVYNGDRGMVEAIFEAKETVDNQMQIVLSFEGKEVTYSRQDLNQIMLAYCSSIHKAQGSEFPIVVAPVLMSYRRMLKRNLLYTAVTRARDYLIIAGEERAIRFAIENDSKDERYTMLKEKLTENEESEEGEDT
ncbi:SF1B family DNA helicase RecD2 [Salibacterium qingdaonense]|uniref:ATP-dependent RecD2 DNA helicase n=1 Tax=Salibacterium qingdaonense TaxID=266892 RepID=A0A1I4JEA6_9BACI|nr:ATP-dependent RecD-like DNA helicase [Salibacterium qingdaonense]SFL64902.1 exodeoxyribonuclease V alpha subunit [Salibacterium qingdaonense]